VLVNQTTVVQLVDAALVQVRVQLTVLVGCCLFLLLLAFEPR
jgi:hypothetical protein